jgi:hypothetical protein
MLSRKNAFAGFFSRNGHQPARSRARTKVAVNLEILESRELLNGAHPRFVQALEATTEFRLSNLNAAHTRLLSRTEFRVMHLAPGQLNAGRFNQFRAGGPLSPAPQITPPKLTLLSPSVPSPSVPSPTVTLPTDVNNPLAPVLYSFKSAPATTLIRPPVSSLPAQPSSPGLQPISPSGGGAPSSTEPSTPGPAPLVHIDIIPPGPPSGPIFF